MRAMRSLPLLLVIIASSALAQDVELLVEAQTVDVEK